MNDEKTDDDVQHFATCTYCGTHTALSAKHLDHDKPIKCPKCGAPLKVVPPRSKGRAEPQMKMKRDYDHDFSHAPWDDGIVDKLSLVQLITVIIIVVFFFVMFIIALISTC